MVLTFLDVTLNEDFLKPSCVFFNTHATLLKVLEFTVIVSKIKGREESTFELGLHLLPISDLRIPPFGSLPKHVFPHKEAYIA